MSLKKRKKAESELDSLLNIIGKETDDIENQAQIFAVEPSRNPKSELSVIGNDTDFLGRRLSSMEKIFKMLPRNADLESVDEDLLTKLLSEATQLCIAVRRGVIGGSDSGYERRREKMLSTSHIVARCNEGKVILRLSVPPLMGKRFKGSYDVYWEVKYALEELQKTQKIHFEYGEKMLLIYKKYVTRQSFLYTCDNDNWEMKRVTNAITEAMNYSDNAQHFSMLYTAVESTEDYVEATVIPLKDLPDFLEYIRNPVPAQPILPLK